MRLGLQDGKLKTDRPGSFRESNPNHLVNGRDMDSDGKLMWKEFMPRRGRTWRSSLFVFSFVFGSWHRFDELCGYPIIHNSLFFLCTQFTHARLFHSCIQTLICFHSAIVRIKKIASFLVFSLFFVHPFLFLFWFLVLPFLFLFWFLVPPFFFCFLFSRFCFFFGFLFLFDSF